MTTCSGRAGGPSGNCPQILPVGPWLLKCATPILAFGQWQTALIATAGLNPSEREFLDRQGRELARPERRFLHRTSTDGGEPSACTLAEARRLAEGYFGLGNAYWEWFRGFKPLLEELGCGFESGCACHTDYISPFATVEGIGKAPASVMKTLRHDGLERWKNVVELMPELRVVLGIGCGWHLMPVAFGFDEWDAIPTPFDGKGWGRAMPGRHLYHKVARLEHGPVHLFWWRPNLNGVPLALLSPAEKRGLADIIKQHAGRVPVAA